MWAYILWPNPQRIYKNTSDFPHQISAAVVAYLPALFLGRRAFSMMTVDLHVSQLFIYRCYFGI